MCDQNVSHHFPSHAYMITALLKCFRDVILTCTFNHVKFLEEPLKHNLSNIPSNSSAGWWRWRYVRGSAMWTSNFKRPTSPTGGCLPGYSSLVIYMFSSFCNRLGIEMFPYVWCMFRLSKPNPKPYYSQTTGSSASTTGQDPASRQKHGNTPLLQHFEMWTMTLC